MVAINIGGGNEHVAMHNLPLILEGSTQAWLNNLPQNSIYNWKDLKEAFVKNFEGTYKWQGGVQDLWLCVQKLGESTRDYIQRWTQLRNSIENVSEV